MIKKEKRILVDLDVWKALKKKATDKETSIKAVANEIIERELKIEQ